MKPNNRKFIPALALLLCCMVAGPVWAKWKKDASQGFPSPRMIKYLALNQEQVEKLRQIYTKGTEKFEAKHRVIEERHSELQAAMRTEASSAKLKRLFASLQEAKEDAAKIRFNQKMDIRDVLTPEQRSKFLAMKEKEKGRKK